MTLPRVVVFGEALIDIVQDTPGHWRSSPGGAPWNVARGLSRLGVNCAFAGAISTDSMGNEIAKKSVTAGLNMEFLQRVNADPLVAVVPCKQPPRYFFAGDSDLRFDPALLPTGWLEAADLCHFSCISLARPPLSTTLLELAKQAKAAGKRISFDPNWRVLMDGSYREVVLPVMLAIADDIKLSDEDLMHIYPGLDEDQALEELRAANPSACILFTRGDRGLVLYCGNDRYEQPAFAVTVADTVGAGDACMAGWLASGFIGNSDYAWRLGFSAACASISCSHTGAYSAERDEVELLLRERC